jgi:hypothetical protein
MKAIAILIVLMMCASAGAQGVAGIWEHKDAASGETYKFVLNNDGSAIIDDARAKYTVAGDKIVVDDGDEKRAYQFKLDGDTMIVSGGDLDGPTKFTRKPLAQLRPKPKNDIAGQWHRKTDAGETRTLHLKDDGTGTFNNTAINWTWKDDILTMEIDGKPWKYKVALTDNAAQFTSVDDGSSFSFERTNPAVTETPAGAKGLAGNWSTGEGTITLSADGTTEIDGKPVKWEADDQYITLRDAEGKFLKIPYKLEGDKLIIGQNPSKTLTRGAAGPAGVWVGAESSIDPQIVLVITQYITLFPDGTVGYAKTEGGATRAAISEQLERFTSFKEKQGVRGKTYGQWKADGDTITIQWQGNFGGQAMQGRIRNGKLVLKAGVMESGAAVEFSRQ